MKTLEISIPSRNRANYNASISDSTSQSIQSIQKDVINFVDN